MKKIFLSLILLSVPCGAQTIVGNYGIQYVSVAPSGTCSSGSPIQVVISTGNIYSCQNGAWAEVGTGSGGGFPFVLGSTSVAANSTVTSVSGLEVNGVTLTAVGSATTFLNGAGGYTTPDGGSPAFSALTPGTNPTVGGFVFSGAGAVFQCTSGALCNANEINGTLMSGLATGIVKNTTGTGAQSIATAGTDYLAPTGSGAALTGITVSQVSGAAPSASPTFSGTVTLPITGSTQCLQVNTSGDISGTGSACGSGGTAFSALTGSTNTTAAMLVGTGASLGVTGSGTIGATSVVGTVNSNTYPASAGFTSGGVFYASSTSVAAVSGLLPAGDFVLGGGAGAAPTATFSIVPGANGGTGNGFFAVSGPTTSLKTFTFPNASATVLTTNAVVTPGQGGTGVANTATLTLGSSNQNWASLGTGIVKNTTTTGAISDAANSDVIALWTGTCSSSTFLRGDGACSSPSATAIWSALGNPTGNLALTMGANTTTFTFGATTSTPDLFKWTDTASNTGTGIMGHFATASGSTEIPWQADANGVGWQVTALGLLNSVAATGSGSFGLGGSTSGTVTQTVQAIAGTPTITWGNTSGTPAVTASSPLAIASTTGTITCTTCVVASSPGLGLAHFAGSTQTVTSSLVAIADFSATGTPSSTTFLRGDNTWATPSGGSNTGSTNQYGRFTATNTCCTGSTAASDDNTNYSYTGATFSVPAFYSINTGPTTNTTVNGTFGVGVAAITVLSTTGYPASPDPWYARFFINSFTSPVAASCVTTSGTVITCASRGILGTTDASLTTGAAVWEIQEIAFGASISAIPAHVIFWKGDYAIWPGSNGMNCAGAGRLCAEDGPALLGATTLALTNINTVATVDQGAPTLAYSTHLTAQTSAITAGVTTASGSVATGLYEVCGSMQITTAGTSGTYSMDVKFSNGSTQTITSGTISNVGTNNSYTNFNCQQVSVVTGTALTYDTTATAIVGTPAYSLDIEWMRLK